MAQIADRNWKDIIKYGNLGITGNFFQKITHIISDYVYIPGDGILVIDSTSGAITITLPPITHWVTKDYRVLIPIMHVAGGNKVTVQLSGSETFLLGNTYFDLGSIPSAFDLYVINSTDLNTYGLVSDLILKAVTAYSGTWAHTAWAALAILPFATELSNSQEEIFLYQSYLGGSIASVADVGDGTVLIEDGAHGLIVGDEITIASTTDYDGDHSVVAVPDADHYTITATFTATATGSWVRPARYTVLTDGIYKLSFQAQIDSTGGAAWDAKGSLYADGTIIDNTSVSVSGAAGENKSMNLTSIEVVLTAGTYIDLRIDNNTLTGNLTGALLQLEMKAI